MSDKMRQIPFGQLLDWCLQEYASELSIFGVPKDKFYRIENDELELFGEKLATPIGPAAGPNTQLAQNIVASYLGGSRFFELKTVQILDELEFPKPCIRAEDECYNTEWSTELSIQGAFEEYVKGWFLLYVLERELGICKDKSFVFNMSVGYDLEGIKTPKMDAYIEGLKDASCTEIFKECKQTLLDRIEEFENLDASYVEAISPNICNSATLSTMHGCPPEEIESITRYLLGEKHINTFIKMNPTLLGYDYVRKAFDDMGYDYIVLKEESFTHDLQYADGVAMVHRIVDYAKELNLGFGVKLSNTLPVQIKRGELPGEEMYMSGRSLYPLTINLAIRIATEFEGKLPISYSGGADFFNIKEIFDTGIAPITLATTILKPGGYMRLTQMAGLFEGAKKSATIDLVALQKLADTAFDRETHRKEYRPVDSRKTDKILPLLDCFIAPCTVGCPIEQDIPQYLKLVSEESYDEAFEVITTKNPLPGVTGTICDHQCMFKCTRLDYDESLAIREMKKVAFDNAAKGAIEKLIPAPLTSDVKVAVVGAGPAGLAAAWFLRKGGLSVTVMDKEKEAGGTVSQVIPEFRIPSETTMTDVEMIRKSGVEFKMGVDPNFSLDELKKNYNYVFLGLGACKENNIELEASDVDILNAIAFLKDYKQGKALDLGEHVVVAGAGNTAMDTARAATRFTGVKDVSIVYRRTKKQMPADAEELELALEDGVLFKELLNPVSLSNGKLRCAVMELGERDESGRRRPVMTGDFKEVDCSTLISSIGEKVDDHFLNGLGIETENGVPKISSAGETSVAGVYLGGDMRLGPATVVKAIADATVAARDILSKHKTELDLSVDGFYLGEEKIWERKGNLEMQKDDSSEGERCLGCQEVCEICMEVCPNRANMTVEIDGRSQIVHVDGMCNECGNCEIFCPYGGAPYKEKFTLFWYEEDFVDSENKGSLLLRGGDKPKFKIRLEAETVVEFDEIGKCDDPSIDAGIASLIFQCYTDYSWLFTA